MRKSPLLPFILFITWGPCFPQAPPQTQKNPVTEHPKQQKDCQKKHLFGIQAEEVSGGAAYHELTVVAPLFGINDVTKLPHLYVSKAIEEGEYVYGSILTDDYRGEIVLSKTAVDELEKMPEPERTPILDGLLGHELSYLEQDEGLRTCKEFMVRSIDPEQERDADRVAVQHMHSGPVKAFLLWSKAVLLAQSRSFLLTHSDITPDGITEINYRLDLIKDVSPDANSNNATQ